MGKVSLKLLVDTKANKVVFAEASQEFVEFLFHILYSLPLGTIVELITDKSVVGFLPDVCKRMKPLNMDKMHLNVTKDSVLKSLLTPRTANTAVMLPLLMFRSPNQFYRCLNVSSSCSTCPNYFSDGKGAVCPNCHKQMEGSCTAYVVPPRLMETATSNSGYMLMDSLEVIPMSSIHGINVVKNLNIKDVTCLEEKIVQVGLTEGVELLKASLQTKDVLTTVFL